MDNLLYMVGDDLRESILALGGIEAFLVRAECVVSAPNVDRAMVDALLGEATLEGCVAELDDALGSLVRVLLRLREAYGEPTPEPATTNA